MRRSLEQYFIAEFLGTLFLLIAIVGSGIMAERLSQGNAALALLANAIATGTALVVLILAFGPISGAHFNPLVTLMSVLHGHLSRRDAAGFVSAQIFGALVGVAMAHLMFNEPLYSLSQRVRSGSSQILSEFVATVRLLLIIASVSRFHATVTPYAVGAYITGAYWFTSSTSFANPAVTLARCLTNTSTGIRVIDVPNFVAAQCVGAIAATLLFRWLIASSAEIPVVVEMTVAGMGKRNE